MNPDNNIKTNLLIEAIQYACTIGNLNDLATDYFKKPEEKEKPGDPESTAKVFFDMVQAIFDAAPASLPTPEEQKETGSLDLPSAQDRSIKNLISLLLDDKDVNVNAQDHTGWPLLFFAVENIDVLKMLFEKRATLTATFSSITATEPNTSSSTPITWDAFTWAIEKRRIDSLTFLTTHLSDREEIDGLLLIFLSSITPNTANDLPVLLKSLNIDVNLLNAVRITPLMWAADEGALDAVKALLALPAINVNITTSTNRTALMNAADKGHLAVVQALLATPNININAIDAAKRTALTLAAEKGHLAVVQALLAIPNININAIDTVGRTALTLAAEKGNLTMVEALLANSNMNLMAHNQGRAAIALAGNHVACKNLIEAALNSAPARIPEPAGQPNAAEPVTPLLFSSQRGTNDPQNSSTNVPSPPPSRLT